MTTVVPVVLCGGSGNRLWPLSREHYPKQLIALTGQHSLLQQTVLRVQKLKNINHSPLIISNQNYRFLIAEQLRQIDVKPATLLLEPCPRNTAAAVALSALQALSTDKNAILLVLPADHLLPETEVFDQAVQLAVAQAQTNHLITFGIKPTYPATGYGYINAGEELTAGVRKVNKFVEKPNLELANDFIKTGHHYWNSGMFVFKASIYLDELATHAPEIYQIAQQAFAAKKSDLNFTIIPENIFAKCPNNSLDYAVMEHTEHAVIIPLNTQWHDIGSWQALSETMSSDQQGNIKQGDVIEIDSKNCYIRAEDRLVATIGIEDQIIVETADAVLIADKNRCEDVKTIVKKLKIQNRAETRTHQCVYRPWGYYESLSLGENFQVKKITVNPGAKLSLQSHQYRAEHWVVVSGIATVTRDQEIFQLTANQSTYIPIGIKHRLTNDTQNPLVIIEVQSGEYLGEDDIKRYDDIYTRETVES